MPTLSGFHPYDGTFIEQPAQIVASLAAVPGMVLSAENAGTTGSLDVGVTDDFMSAVYCDKPITSSDSDYASTKTRNVWMIQHEATQLWKARVSSGTPATATEVWDYADVVAGGLTLTLTDTNKDFRITKVLDGTANNGVVVGYFPAYTAEPSA